MYLIRFILPCLLLVFQPLKAKVEAPNYHFDLSEFNSYLPGSPISPLSGQFEVLKKDQSTILYQTQIKKEKYHITVFVTVEKDSIIDFYARLPSYFLHDVFLESLVKKYGKQDRYQKKDEHAVYSWSKEDVIISYSATCTITCFPIYLSIASRQHKKKSLLEILKRL